MQAAAAGAGYLALVLWSMSAVLEEPDTYLLGPPLNVASKIARTDQQMVLATVIRHARILVTDPRELRNIADDHKELTHELVAAATRFADAHDRENAVTITDHDHEQADGSQLAAHKPHAIPHETDRAA